MLMAQRSFKFDSATKTICSIRLEPTVYTQRGEFHFRAQMLMVFWIGRFQWAANSYCYCLKDQKKNEVFGF